MFRHMVLVLALAVPLSSSPCNADQAYLHVFVYRFSASAPSKGKLGEKEVAIVDVNPLGADFKAVLVAKEYLREWTEKGTPDAVVLRELIAVR